MIELIQSNPLALPLIISGGTNIVLSIVLTIAVFLMRGQTPPEIVAEVAELIPVAFLQSQLDRYQKVAEESNNVNKELLTHLMRGGLNTLEAVQSSLADESKTQ